MLVPELSGAAAAEIADLTTAALTAAALLPPRWIVIGTGSADGVVGPDGVGTFAGYGADVRVRLAPAEPIEPTEPLVDLPLCALIVGWLRGQARPEASAEVRIHRTDHDSRTAVQLGHRLRTEIDQLPGPVGVLVAADGANTLTPSAPGGYDAGSVAVQRALDDALANGDTAALTRQPAGILGRVAFTVLAGLAEPGPRSAKELYRGAPYGVGYFAGAWQL